MIYIPIAGAIYLMAVTLAPALLVGGILKAIFDMLHLGPVLIWFNSFFSSLSNSILKIVPVGTLLQLIVFLFLLGIVIHVFTLHRKTEKYRKLLFYILGVIISFVDLIIISSPYGKVRYPTPIEYIALVLGLIIAVILVFYSIYKLIKTSWHLLGKNTKIKQIRDNSFIQTTVITTLTGFLLYSFYSWLREGFSTPGNEISEFSGVFVFIAVGFFFLRMLGEFISDLNYLLKKLINKI